MLPSLNIQKFQSLFFDKAVLVLTTLIFVYLFEGAFYSSIVNEFSYFGFKKIELDLYNIILIKLILIINTLTLPLQVRRPSEFLNLFLYLFIYLPSSVVLFSVNPDWLPQKDAFDMFFVLSSCILIISLSSRLPRLNVKRLTVKKKYFKIANYLFFILFCFILLKSLTNLRFSGITELVQLNETRQNQPISGVFVYIYLWIITFFIGLFLSEYSKFSVRVKLILVASVYFLFAFSMGAKILLVGPFIFIFILFWLNYLNNRTYLFFASFAAFFIVINVVSFFLPDVGFALNALFTFRTLSISSLSFAIYFDYFNINDFTYFQHVGVVNTLTDLLTNNGDKFIPLPVILAGVYGLGNFNASFFVNDGYASLGYPGMVLVTILFSIVLYFLDCISRPLKLSTICLALTYFGMYLGNISLFTLLVSHGLLILFIYFYIFSRYVLFIRD